MSSLLVFLVPLDDLLLLLVELAGLAWRTVVLLGRASGLVADLSVDLVVSLLLVSLVTVVCRVVEVETGRVVLVSESAFLTEEPVPDLSEGRVYCVGLSLR